MQRLIDRTFSSSRLRRFVLPACLLGCLFLATTCRGQKRLSKAQIEARLRFLTTVDHYSPSAPLSQDALMKLALEQRYWGVFPEAYWGKEKRPGADGYITRADTRRFLQDLTGQDLKIWKSDADEIQGDEMRWTYHTSNTTYQRAAIHLIGRKDPSKNRVDVTFQIFDYATHSNGESEPPRGKVGTGSATLLHKGQTWTVTTWKANRTPQ